MRFVDPNDQKRTMRITVNLWKFIGFVKLLESGEASLIKFVWEHAVGKPREKMDVDVDNPFGTVIINAPGGIDVNLPDNTEEPDNLPEDEQRDTSV